MKKCFIMLLSMLCMLCMIPGLTASAAGVVIYDEGNRLAEKEKAECMKELQAFANESNLNIAVILSIYQYSDGVIEKAAAETYDLQYGKKTDGVCLYIDLSAQQHPYDYLDTSGLGQFYYTNAKSNDRVTSILHNVERYLYPIGNENTAGALHEFANQLQYYYNKGIPERYYIYDDVYHEYYHVENGVIITTTTKPYKDMLVIILCTGGGLLIGLVAAFVLKKTVQHDYQLHSDISPTNYINNHDTVYQQKYDHFVTKRIKKRYIDRSSGHGGYGGGHSSGGHGGGGSHR